MDEASFDLRASLISKFCDCEDRGPQVVRTTICPFSDLWFILIYIR